MSNSLFGEDSGLYSQDELEVKNFVLTQLLQPAQKFRKKQDLRWFVYNSYYDNNSWLMYNRSSGRWENMNVDSWRNKISIPEAFVSHRSIKSIILNKDPVYDVVPVRNDNYFDIEAGEVDQATGKSVGAVVDGPKVKAARVAGGILEYLEYKIDLKKKRDDVVDDALKMGNGYWKFGFDQESADGAGEASVCRANPFSVYIDPNTTDITNFENCRYIIYAVPRDVTYVQLKYGKEVKADNKMSSSSYEDMYKKNSSGSSDRERISDTVMVYEAWVREPYNVQLETGDNIVKYRMRCITCTEAVLLRDVDDPLHIGEFPFECLQINYRPGDPYADGNIKYQKDIIDQINKRLSQIADSTARMSNPRFLAAKGSVQQDEVTDKPGDFVEYALGFEKPQVIPGASVSGDIMDLVNFLMGKIQDAAGIHDVSRGVLPAGISSGRQLELAQAADTMVLGPYIKSLEDFLTRAAKKILRIVKGNYPSDRQVVIRGKQGALKEINIVPEDIDFSDVRVEISSFLANTKSARQDILLQLKQAGVIAPKTVLENYEFPDIDSIVEDLNSYNASMQPPQPPANDQQLPGPGVSAPSMNPDF